MIQSLSNLNSTAFAATLASLLSALFLVFTKRWHAKLSADQSYGIQKVHQGQTPRIGGVCLIVGFLTASLVIVSNSSGQNNQILFSVLLACLPALIFGLIEDITKKVSTRVRLLATMCSGVIAWALTGYALFRVDVPVVDSILAFTPIAVLFTAFAVGGVANAINMIDGFNGLASGTIIICIGSLGIMAWQVNDYPVFMLCIIIAAVTFGFLLVNFPYGKLFLGDGGAYTLGFMLAWVAVILSCRHPEAISPWAPLLACSYPILEAVMSMARRFARCKALDLPDRTHLHSLIYRRVIPRYFKFKSRTLRNSAVSPLLWLFAMLPATLAVWLKGSTIYCVAAFVATAFIYAVIYTRISHFGWHWPRLMLRRRRPTSHHA